MTLNFRKILFWLHLAAGCVAGLVILVMSLTGVLLTYERQILAWSERGQLRADPPAGARRLPVSELLNAVAAHRGDLAENATLTLRSDPREPAEIRIGREGAVYVNAYTGAILTGGAATARTAFQKITAWHRVLGVQGAGRATARAITGACNLAFLVLIVSGAYLWLPRRWSWQSVRSITLFRVGLGGKARDFNWHNVFGIWALIPLFFVVLTALPMSYSWANSLLFRMTGSEPPAPPAGGRRPAGGPVRAAAVSDLDRLWTRAANQFPGWSSITARAALRVGEPATFTLDAGDGGQPQKRVVLTLDPATAEPTRLETFADANAGRRLRTWSRFVHTGEYYGILGQTLAGLGSLAGVMLVWTGIALALRRLAAWNARRRKRPGPMEEQAAMIGAGEGAERRPGSAHSRTPGWDATP